jgi:hypothetical protein
MANPTIDPKACNDPRGARLRAFDIQADAFLTESQRRTTAGGASARRDIERLWRLAEGLVRDLGRWRERLDGLEAASISPLDVGQTAELILETVFDEVLSPEANRLLGAALALELAPA